ncbi:hypothetical protein NX722_08035 [Endozoicomonas gorgoniicola]|uniref:Uncharacterized protein n=1 Tax=Endozoicomonas gorgoniicola TaxID=1234144 RepID=A0ABT3MUE6_9GAMM|nr:hypothetical protein [Endozoicomonas gorgoniicola]MCW7552599.1 hypothetical protein [Endozoicomonas gorgoniicola]
MKYYNPATQTEAIPGIHDVTSATKKTDMPAEAQEWFTRPARDGYEWKCLNGKWPEEVPIEPAPAATRRQSACAAIDHAAGNARSHFATSSAFIESEYQRAYDTAVAWINSGYQGDAPKPVKSDAEAYGRNEQEAAQYIKATGDYWFAALDDIRDIRLKGKQAVKASPDDADFMAIAQPFIDRLEALQPHQ